MKNELIVLGEEVPKELRLSLYKEALEYYKARMEGNRIRLAREHEVLGLCMLLPILLWDLKYYLDPSPDEIDWNYNDTTKSFPEIESGVLELEAIPTGFDHDEKTPMRILILEEAIKQLESGF